MSLKPEMIEVAPLDERRKKLAVEIFRVLEEKLLLPQQAGKLAGKATFLNRTLMGRVGRAAVKALYARQHAPCRIKWLSPELEAALWALLDIVVKAKPRTIDMINKEWKRTVVYADAFVKVGERRWALADAKEYEDKYGGKIPDDEGIEDNGYGIVLFPVDEKAKPLYFSGVVPKALLVALAPTGNYIFMLEALAQCSALWAFWPMLRGPYWSFVDNAAAQWALTKGYSGTSKEANVLTTLFWSIATAKQADPWLERVPSKANCSDAISRGDFEFAKANNWIQCEVASNDIWKLLERALKEELRNLPVMAEKLCVVATARELVVDDHTTDDEALEETRSELKLRLKRQKRSR